MTTKNILSGSHRPDKSVVLSNWRSGDDAEVARRLFDWYNLKYSVEMVRKWRIGERNAKAEYYIVLTAERIQGERLKSWKNGK